MKANTASDNPPAPRMYWSPLIYKGTLGALVVLAFAVPLGMAALPFVEFFNGMAAQPKAREQMTYGRTYERDDDKELLTERPPVEGTIPRGYIAYPFDHMAATVEDAKKVGAMWDNPLPRSAEHMLRGQALFNIHCIVCHGKQGQGDGSATGPDRFPAPPSLQTEQARGYVDGTIYHLITKGTEKMPSYADKLDATERWQVIHYLRALQRAMNPKPEDLRP